MQILSQAGGVAQTNCFLLADESTGKAVLFDAPDHTTTPLLDQVEKRGWELVGLWLTHGHFDHFADAAAVKKRFPSCKILIHAEDETKAKHPEIQTRLFGLPFIIPPVQADAHVHDNDELQFGNIKARVLHTPGHSPGHVSYYLPEEKVLVGGDLIIGGSVGRTDLPDSDHMKLIRSIQRVMALPPETRLLGGHGPITTLEEERMNNYFVQEALNFRA